MNRIRKGTVSLLLSVLLLLVTSGNALAFDSKTMNRGSILVASITWPTNYVLGSNIKQLDLHVTQGDERIYVEVNLWIFKDGVNSYLNGGKYVTADDFTIDRKLTSASLSEVELVLYPPLPKDGSPPSTETKTIKIGATWQGTGELVKSTYRTQTKDDGISISKSAWIFRNAESVIVFDGVKVGVPYFNGLLSEFEKFYLSIIK